MTPPTFVSAIRHLIACLVLLPGFAFATTIISDPVGDVASGPDIVSMSGAYDAASVFLTVAFAPGTFDTNNFHLVILLDPDLNPSTFNFSLTISQIIGFGFANLSGPGVPSGAFLFPFAITPDYVATQIPLALLGGDDGIMQFSASASVNGGFVLGNGPPAPLPDEIAPGLTTSVDAPVPLVLFLGALPALWLARRKRR